MTEQNEQRCCYNSERPHPFNLTSGCQFDAETDFFEVDGDHYCRFHMPLKHVDGTPTGKSNWNVELKNSFYQSISQYLTQTFESPFFASTADLSGVQFPQGFDFKGWGMLNAIRAGLIQNEETIPDSGIPFPRICAHRAVFAHGTDFRELEIPSHSSFSEAHFGDWVKFSGAQFGVDTQFDETVFGVGANFAFCRYEGPVTFNNAKFGNEANFEHSLFESYAIFLSGSFGDELTFRDVTFFETAFFSKCEFEGAVDFSARDFDAKFNMLDFRDCKFASRWPLDWGDEPWEDGPPVVKFTNRMFADSADFAGAVFNVAPEFHEAKIHQGCTLSDAIYNDVQSSNAVSAYRTLKLAMEQSRDWIAMAKFYALEQESIRLRSSTPWATKFMSWSYGMASDYGQSFVRPLLGLGATFLVAFCLYSGYYLVDGGQWRWSVLNEIAVFDLRQMIKPFDAMLRDRWPHQLRGHFSWLIGTIAFFQTIATAGFVTLFILAVRRRFRMA